MERLSAAAARRVALAAQGFAQARPASVGAARMLRTIARSGLLQIDSVSVVARAHYLPLFARLGPYARELLDQAAWGTRRTLFEYWAHEASLLPVSTQPLLRWRMARAARLERTSAERAAFVRERRDYIEAVFARFVTEGPAAASALEGPRGPGGWWGWSDAKRAVEYLFWAGRLTTATRRGFERVYDLPERVLPAAVLAMPTPPEAEAQRGLLGIAARALGVFAAGDLRDYFRLDPASFAARLPELAEDGTIVPVAVEGWAGPGWMHREATPPRRVAACALLCPFDPVVWNRDRTERLFGFHYRIGIYTPAAQRVHGYYVLPFLLGDRLAARVDLKSDRASGALLVLGAHPEPLAPPETAERLRGELAVMAGWLGLERVEVRAGGELAGRLQGVLPEAGAGAYPAASEEKR